LTAIGTRRTTPSISGSIVTTPMPAAGFRQFRKRPHEAPEFPHPRQWIGAEANEGCGGRLRVAGQCSGLRRRGEHDAAARDRRREDAVRIGQSRERAPARLVEPRHPGRQPRRRHPVGLGEEDVEPDDGGAELAQPVDQLRREASAATAIARASPGSRRRYRR